MEEALKAHGLEMCLTVSCVLNLLQYQRGKLAFCTTHCTMILGDGGDCIFDGNVIQFIDVTFFPGFKELNNGAEDVTSGPIKLPERMIFGDTIVDTAYVS